MGQIGQYLLSIVASALLLSICNVLTENKGTLSSVLKLIIGIVLATMIVSPWSEFNINDVFESVMHVDSEASGIVQEGQEIARKEVAAHIKSKIETYILDKAHDLGLEVTVAVTLTNDENPTIDHVSICGSAAPFSRKQMILQITEDLGIAEECLTWLQSSG